MLERDTAHLERWKNLLKDVFSMGEVCEKVGEGHGADLRSEKQQ